MSCWGEHKCLEAKEGKGVMSICCRHHASEQNVQTRGRVGEGKEEKERDEDTLRLRHAKSRPGHQHNRRP